MKIRVNLNKNIGLASVSWVQNPDLEGFLGGEDEDEDDQEPSEPLSSLPIIPELGIIFSRSTSEPTLPSSALTHKCVTSHTLRS